MPDPKTKSKSKPRSGQSSIRSIPDILQFWQDLRAAVLDKADQLGPAAPQLQALEELIPRAHEMRARHEALKADKLKLTQDFRALRVEGKEVARRLQHAVQANLGTQSEGLSQFNIRLRRRKPTTAEEQPPGGEAPAPTPGSTVKAAEPEARGDQR